MDHQLSNKLLNRACDIYRFKDTREVFTGFMDEKERRKKESLLIYRRMLL